MKNLSPGAEVAKLFVAANYNKLVRLSVTNTFFEPTRCEFRHNDTQLNDIQHDDIQHNETQHNSIRHNRFNFDNQHK